MINLLKAAMEDMQPLWPLRVALEDDQSVGAVVEEMQLTVCCP